MKNERNRTREIKDMNKMTNNDSCSFSCIIRFQSIFADI